MKTILIPGWKTGENSYGCGTNHLTFISKFGHPRILMPWEDLVQGDLLYLPGGLDINPSSYNTIPSFHTSNQDVFKQYFFDNNLKSYIDAGMPIFGICLGFQELNVFFGGSIIQHLPYHPQSKDRWEEGHEVNIVGTDKKFKVNSHHHQGVKARNLSKELDALCIADDGIIEAFKHKTLPIAGIQWHSEEWYDKFSTDLIKSIMK